MRRSNEKMVVECYNYTELINMLPVNYDVLYSVRIEWYGFVHDCGFKVILIPNRDGYGKGWETFKQDFAEACKEASARWDYAERYAYH